jgi:hypothetical protein
MARNDRIVRVEALKQALCASRAGVPLKTLADRHDWNLRGLYRDIKALKSAGYIVDTWSHARAWDQVLANSDAWLPR